MNAGRAPSGSKPLTLGRYRLLLELGHGGMAHVYLGLSTGLAGFSKLVVLKVMRDELREHQSSLSMFLGEARLAARMNHPNVVQTSEVGEDDGRYFICMEYLEGQTLGRVLRKTIDAPLPMGARLELVCQMLDGLSYLHSFTDLDGTPLGLVHRDISPNNVFVTFDGTVKVLDFGVAKAVGISHVTEAGTFKGKVGYAAPEQILGRSDQRSDVFAVGVLLWEILTYRRLTQDRTQAEVVQGRMAGMDMELMQSGSGVPDELLKVCAKAVAKDPEYRYASAASMREVLRAYIAAHSLEFPPEKLRELLHEIYDSERREMRALIDQRMKQVQLEDEHPSQFERRSTVPGAPSLFGSLSGGISASTGSLARRVEPSRVKWLTALLAVAAVAGVVGATLSRRDAPVEKRTASSVPRSAASEPPPTAGTPSTSAPALVTLTLSASPPEARLLLDGATLEGNPFTGQLPKDSALHRLEVRAPGHRTEARMIRLDQDLKLNVVLALHSAPAAAAPPGEPPAAVAPTPKAAPRRNGDAATSGTSDAFVRKNRDQNARPIDNTDPYGP